MELSKSLIHEAHGGEAARRVKLRIHLSFVLGIMNEASQPRFVRFNDVLISHKGNFLVRFDVAMMTEA